MPSASIDRSLPHLLLAVAVCVCACGRRDKEANVTGSASAKSAETAPAASTPANALPIPSASVSAVVNPDGLAPYRGPTGSVEGTITLSGPDAPPVPDLDTTACPAALDTYGKLFRTGPARPDGLRAVADAVVVITGYTQGYVPEQHDAKRVTILPSCGYESTTIAITFGQRVEIANTSAIAFAPVLADSVQHATMIAPPLERGEPVKLFPQHVGAFALTDHLQTYVHETLVVLRQPLHDVTDLRGHYRIDGVPVGHMQVGALLGSINASTRRDVDVRAGIVESEDMTITYTPPPRTGNGPASPVIH